MNQDKTISAPKPTYWVRSKQTNGPCGMPVPVQFKTLTAAKRRRHELNLRRGPYHPGYFVEVQDDRPPLFSLGTGRS